MSNQTVRCPFCFKESPHGVKYALMPCKSGLWRKPGHSGISISIRGVRSRMVSIFIDRKHSCLSHYVFRKLYCSYMYT